MNEDRKLKAKQRFKTGQWVQYDGLYADDWGGDLVLIQGDLFPVHPQMGNTNWTYVGQSPIYYTKNTKINGYDIGY